MTVDDRAHNFPELLRTSDIAVLLQRSPRTARRLCARGKIPAISLGRPYITTLDAITALVVEVSAHSRRKAVANLTTPGRGVRASTAPPGSRSSADRKKRGKKVTESLAPVPTPPMLERVEPQEEV